MERTIEGIPKLPFAVLVLLLFTGVIFISALTSVSWTTAYMYLIQLDGTEKDAEFHEGLWDTCACGEIDFVGDNHLQLRGGEDIMKLFTKT